MIFVDASAMIALIAGGPDADRLADALEPHRLRLISPIAAWETVVGLCRDHTCSVARARETLDWYVAAANLTNVLIGEREYALALQAFAEYGEGRHAAA